MAHMRVVLLSNDVTTLNEEFSEMFWDLLGVSRVGDNYSRQVAKIRSDAFMEGWTACLTELDIPEDNGVWAKAAPAPEFPKSSAPYSPLILLDFDELEYMNWSEEDENVVDVTVPLGNEVAQDPPFEF
ncbi:hypothetical protein Acr_06g0009160 [Actinidia rufa]|uniref:Uncharacterized protein n=1 Tax=Actinidia rufa TaxID=165716 RepID=A0A7J0ERY6_9ERIC|nr:hypothetical protein Acr_06g0009160 [Actinidia rufa]